MESEESRACSSCRALQGFEPLQRDSAGSRHELEQPGPHLLVVTLHDPPEPNNLGALGRAVLQTGVALPVGEVYSAQTSDNLTETLRGTFKYIANLPTSSSSLSSKGLSEFWGISSWKPFCKARNCCSIPCINLKQATLRKMKKVEKVSVGLT